MSAGVVLSVELAPGDRNPITFQWDPDAGEVDMRNVDNDLITSCTLDDLNELIESLRVFVDHYEARTQADE